MSEARLEIASSVAETFSHTPTGQLIRDLVAEVRRIHALNVALVSVSHEYEKESCRLAAAAAELAALRPKAVALDALEEWMAVQGQGIEAESGSCTAYVVLVDAEGGAIMQALGGTLADLGTALAAQAATGEGTQIEEVTDDES